MRRSCRYITFLDALHASNDLHEMNGPLSGEEGVNAQECFIDMACIVGIEETIAFRMARNLAQTLLLDVFVLQKIRGHHAMDYGRAGCFMDAL